MHTSRTSQWIQGSWHVHVNSFYPKHANICPQQKILISTWCAHSCQIIHPLLEAMSPNTLLLGKCMSMSYISDLYPSKNRGRSLPRMVFRSTPSSVMAARRMIPPLEPSRMMANANAVKQRANMGHNKEFGKKQQP